MAASLINVHWLMMRRLSKPWRSRRAQQQWKETTVAERMRLCQCVVEQLVARTDAIADELTRQMGRPRCFTPGEVRGFEERARYMIEIAESALEPLPLPDKPSFHRYIRHEPLGTVFVIAAWNYPYLIAVNSIVPALLAGNTVILKHSSQTPLCAERLAECMVAAGMPEGVFQVLHLDHADAERVVQDPRIDFVAFTGSVKGGQAIQRRRRSVLLAPGWNWEAKTRPTCAPMPIYRTPSRI